MLPSFVTATVWRFILRPDGVFNELLAKFGIDGGQWLIGDKAFWALVIVDIWASWPFVYMMSIAGLQTIPNELYEAADIDGVTWFKKIRYVVIPQIRNQLAARVAAVHTGALQQLHPAVRAVRHAGARTRR